MPPRKQPCRYCGREIVLLPTLALAWWPFEPQSLPREQVATGDRWALRRQPLAAVPVDDDGPISVLARHYCADYQFAKQHVARGLAEVTEALTTPRMKP